MAAAVRDRCRQTSVRRFAAHAGVDAANLAHAMNGRRRPNRVLLAKLEATLARSDREHYEAG